MADAARLYPQRLCVDCWTHAKSRSAPVIAPLISMETSASTIRSTVGLTSRCGHAVHWSDADAHQCPLLLLATNPDFRKKRIARDAIDRAAETAGQHGSGTGDFDVDVGELRRRARGGIGVRRPSSSLVTDRETRGREPRHHLPIATSIGIEPPHVLREDCRLWLTANRRRRRT